MTDRDATETPDGLAEWLTSHPRWEWIMGMKDQRTGRRLLKDQAARFTRDRGGPVITLPDPALRVLLLHFFAKDRVHFIAPAESDDGRWHCRATPKAGGPTWSGSGADMETCLASCLRAKWTALDGAE